MPPAHVEYADTPSIEEAVSKLLDVQQRLVEEASRVRDLAETLRRLGDDQKSEGDPPT